MADGAGARRPTLRFLFAHPAHFVALGFGAGLAPAAPGTFGTLVAIPIAFLLWRSGGGDLGFLLATAGLGAAGVWACAVTGRHLGAPDHGAIVIDEVVAFLLVLFFAGPSLTRIAFAFLLFRLFDIAKPPPARQIDERWKTGAGVMADDLVAAGYALVALAIGQRAAAALGIAT